MKVNIDRETTLKVKRRIRVETDNYIFELRECKVTGELIINKVDGVDNGKLFIFPRYSNEINIK
jgi:hypothetical protein